MDKRTYKLLRNLYRVNFLTDNSSEMRYLISQKYATLHPSGKTDEIGQELCDGFCITLEGRAYVEKRRRDFWAFILPYAITTLIALTNLCATIVANWEQISNFWG